MDTDYVIESGESDCATVTHERSTIDGDDDLRADYENLSTTDRQQFQRTLAKGRHVVKDGPVTAPDFQFTRYQGSQAGLNHLL